MATAEDILDSISVILPRERDSTIVRYIVQHNKEFAEIEEENQYTINAHQIDNATGDDLDRIGSMFGELGERRGRNNSDYRSYLKGIVNSFNGRGSLSGLKFAIASAINTDTSNITIDEDFQELKYDIRIENVDSEFLSSAVNDLAELADPSAVELGQAIIVLDGETVIISESSSTITNTRVGLGGGTLDLDGTKALGG